MTTTDTTKALREALKPFAKLAAQFASAPHAVVEVSYPHPDNPSPRIEPFFTEHFRNLLAALAHLTDTPAGTGEGDRRERYAREICQVDERNGAAPWDWYDDKGRARFYEAADAIIASDPAPVETAEQKTAGHSYTYDAAGRASSVDGVPCYVVLAETGVEALSRAFGEQIHVEPREFLERTLAAMMTKGRGIDMSGDQRTRLHGTELRSVQDFTSSILAALASTPQPSPPAVSGWRMVPEEPTEEMLEAGEDARRENTDVYLDGSEVAGNIPGPVFSAMIAAAPLPPAPDLGGGADG